MKYERWVWVWLVAGLLVAGSASAVMTHRYDFVGDPNDRIGEADGVLINNTGAAAYVDGVLELGNTGVQGSNANPLTGDYVDLPNGTISANGNQATFEFWLTWNGPAASNWQELMSFGTSNGGEDTAGGAGNSSYIMFTPRSGQEGNRLRFGYRNGATAVENILEYSATMPIDEQVYVAVSWDGAAGVATMYVNGEAVDSGPIHFDLATINDNNNWLGRSQWPDPLFVGSYDEFRIYNEALSDSEVRANWLAGTSVTPAQEVFPAQGQPDVDLAVTLEWAPGQVIEGDLLNYQLYFGEDFEAVAAATPDDADLYLGEFDESVTQFALNTLDTDMTYYWRVDEIVFSDPNTDTVLGPVWSFETIKTLPILTGPANTRVQAGETAVFTVGIDTETPVVDCQWYKVVDEGDDLLLADGVTTTCSDTETTLTIEDVQASDVGQYYAVVTNAAGPQQSAAATLGLNQLVAHWPFDEGTQLIAEDVSGFGNDAVLVTAADNAGPTWITDGALGGALSFDGVNDMLTLVYGEPNGIPINDQSYTFSAWVRPTATANSRGIIGWGNYGTGRQVNAFKLVGAGQMDNYWWAADISRTFSPINDGEWHHVAVAYDGTVRTLYLDGLALGSDTPGDNNVQQVINFAIGRTWAGATPPEFFEGGIDDVRVYDYGLDGYEIAALYYDVSGEPVCVEQPELDLNDNCIVDLPDFAILAEQWLDCGVYPAEACGQ